MYKSKALCNEYIQMKSEQKCHVRPSKNPCAPAVEVKGDLVAALDLPFNLYQLWTKHMLCSSQEAEWIRLRITSRKITTTWIQFYVQSITRQQRLRSSENIIIKSTWEEPFEKMLGSYPASDASRKSGNTDWG